MFKHILIIIFVVFIFFVTKIVISSFHKVVVHKDIIKYSLSDSDKTLIDKQCDKVGLQDIKSNCIFYQDYTWNTKNNNYIYDTKVDKYYLIDKGYYYFIPDLKRYTVHIGKNTTVKVLNSLNKVVFL